MTTVSDLDPDQRARLAAKLVDEVGVRAVNRHRASSPIQAPAPGIAVLACRCGRPIDLAHMRRAQPQFVGTHPPILPIVCSEECVR